MITKDTKTYLAQVITAVSKAKTTNDDAERYKLMQDASKAISAAMKHERDLENAKYYHMTYVEKQWFARTIERTEKQLKQLDTDHSKDAHYRKATLVKRLTALQACIDISNAPTYEMVMSVLDKDAAWRLADDEWLIKQGRKKPVTYDFTGCTWDTYDSEYRGMIRYCKPTRYEDAKKILRFKAMRKYLKETFGNPPKDLSCFEDYKKYGRNSTVKP